MASGVGVASQVENAILMEDAEGCINLHVISPERIEGMNVESESPTQHAQPPTETSSSNLGDLIPTLKSL